MSQNKGAGAGPPAGLDVPRLLAQRVGAARSAGWRGAGGRPLTKTVRGYIQHRRQANEKKAGQALGPGAPKSRKLGKFQQPPSTSTASETETSTGRPF